MKKHDTLTPQTLIDVLSAAPHPLNLDEILRRAGLSRRLKREALASLRHMAGEGSLARLRGGTWTVADRLKKISGILSMRRSGAGFVRPEQRDPHGVHAVFIAPEAMGDAWDGDLVEAALLPGRHGSEGRVLRVLRRSREELTAQVLHAARRDALVLARPMDTRLAFDMLIDVSGLPAAPREGELIRVTPGERLPSPPPALSPPAGRPPAPSGKDARWSGTAVRSLEPGDEVAAQEQITKFSHAIPQGFPDHVRAEAETVARREPEGEEPLDLRDLPLVTIDGEDARDFDDAIYVERQNDGWRLLVAIADVSLYVRPRSALDREARERGNSAYFPASVEPMLPEALSGGVCSLRPGEDRRVLTVDLRMDRAGRIQGTTFAAALMRSRARLTYTGVQALLDAAPRDDPPEGKNAMPAEVAAMLREAAQLADLLIRRRRGQGGLDLDLPEAEWVLDKGRVMAVRHRRRLFSHRLIEAFMVAANEAVAAFLGARGAPVLYRTHPEPGPEKMADLIRSLNATGLPLPRAAARMTPEARLRWLHGVLEAAAGTDQAFLVKRLVLRSMMQARYDPRAEGHFGLASPLYCHFTSPIRRYADLVTHRALRRALGLSAGGPLPAGHRLLTVAEQCNSRERAAQNAEREITRRLGCLLLRGRVGEVMHGVISGVMPFGLFVELEGMPLEGMVRVESLGRDFFGYDGDRQELRGRLSGRAYRLGGALDVRLTDVNVERLEIRLTPAAADPPPRKGRAPHSGRRDMPPRAERRHDPPRRTKTQSRAPRVKARIGHKHDPSRSGQ
ncbi:MAG: VacB/RNase II family 3'-5' exoribonuclease [Desulfovibrionaceae bacterium]|nr:VacB/RNase II family 3'-5' exoribonuclease [Desulfovibrionaceae bacterium]